MNRNLILLSTLVITLLSASSAQAKYNGSKKKAKAPKVIMQDLKTPDIKFTLNSEDNVKAGALYFYADLVSPETLSTKFPQFANLEIFNIETAELKHSIVAARAFFKMEMPKQEIDFDLLNNKKVLNSIYDSDVRELDNYDDSYALSKSLVFSSIDYMVKVSNTDKQIVDSPKFQLLLNNSIQLDNVYGDYLGSIYHQQYQFSKMFSGGYMIANFYRVGSGDNSQLLVSAYSMTYPRVSAIKKLNKFLFWTSAKEKLRDEIKSSLKTVYKLSRGFK
jgi:hypothetical protein